MSSPKKREEKFLTMAGCVGLATVVFLACGGDDGTTSSETSSGTDASTSTSDSSTTSDAGSTSTALGCTTTTATADNTAAVTAAANALLATLTTTQQTTIQLTNSVANVEQWSNLPTTAIPRNGVMIGDMSSTAQTAAIALMTAATGTTGATRFAEIRAADDWLVSDGHAGADSYGSGRYYFAFVGTPSTTTAWTLQIAGHHLAYNFTYNGPCTSATPLFDGTEPKTWTGTDSVAHAPLEDQRASSVAVIEAVASDSTSLLSGTFTDVVNGPSNANSKGDTRYPTLLTYPTGTTGRGVLVGSLSSDKQALVKTAIEAWVKNVADPVAKALLAEYESDAAFAGTYVGYSGATDLTTQTSYFRIDGPRVWIEYTIQGGIVYQGQVHYHTLWRDKTADYGAEFVDAVAVDAGAGGFGAGGGPGGDGGMMGGPPEGAAPPGM